MKTGTWGVERKVKLKVRILVPPKIAAHGQPVQFRGLLARMSLNVRKRPESQEITNHKSHTHPTARRTRKRAHRYNRRKQTPVTENKPVKWYSNN